MCKYCMVLALVVISLVVHAAVGFAAVTGTVTDMKGAPVAGATVTFTDESNPDNKFSDSTDAQGKYEIDISGATEVDASTPSAFSLGQNYPNPFNPTTTIPFTLDSSVHISVSVYNIMGQRVATVIDNYMSAGSHFVTWNGMDDRGNHVSAGIYLYQLSAGRHAETKKMLLLDGGVGSYVAKPSINSGTQSVAKIAAEATYTITITHSGIISYEKTGVTITDGQTMDFVVTLIGDPGANNLGDMAWDGRSLWVSGSSTLNHRIGEGSGLYDWISYKQLDGFGLGSITALVASGDTLITAWGYSAEYLGEMVPYGDGISLSLDRGISWKHITVKDLFPDRAGFQNPGRYTTTYDILLSQGNIWCSTTSGFLLRSSDMGKSWTNILPNNETLNFSNPNHHGQCVDAYGDTLWVGTFQGMNASFDSGKTWMNFAWTTANSENISDPKPGNFVYAVEHKVVCGKTHIWAGCDRYVYPNLGQYGICHTDDNGKTWQYKTTRFNAWNFSFGHNGASDPAVSDSTVFAASDSGLVVTNDLGDHWKVMEIRESDERFWNSGEMVSSVVVVNDTLWATSANGLARTTDWGKTWKIFKGITRVKTLDTGKKIEGISAVFDNEKTYSFPNPFLLSVTKLIIQKLR